MKTILEQLINGQHLTADQMTATMQQIMHGECPDVQMAAFLVALRIKGETVTELAAAARVMRSLATPVKTTTTKTLDTCGTGGDGTHTFNVSTAAAFVAAAAGVRVAKHGNRSVSSTSGSADVLEHAGANLQLPPEAIARAIDSIGVGFMFAVHHHSAMKHAIAVRRSLAIRTVFNLLGPLSNPASCSHQVLGVYSKAWLEPMAQTLQALGSEAAMVVHAEDGLDELSIAATSHVAELKNGVIQHYTITPESVGLARHSLNELTVNSITDSYDMLIQSLTQPNTPQADMVALNAGAAIYTYGITLSLPHGVAMAQDMISTGLAMEAFNAFIQFTQAFGESS